jgi:hypothetical protein
MIPWERDLCVCVCVCFCWDTVTMLPHKQPKLRPHPNGDSQRKETRFAGGRKGQSGQRTVGWTKRMKPNVQSRFTRHLGQRFFSLAKCKVRFFICRTCDSPSERDFPWASPELSQEGSFCVEMVSSSLHCLQSPSPLDGCAQSCDARFQA